jgi:hypothetical protein
LTTQLIRVSGFDRARTVTLDAGPAGSVYVNDALVCDAFAGIVSVVGASVPCAGTRVMVTVRAAAFGARLPYGSKALTFDVNDPPLPTVTVPEAQEMLELV